DASGELEGPVEGRGAFPRFLDDIEDVAKVDDIGCTKLRLRQVVGVPSRGSNTSALQIPNVPPCAAAVVEHRRTTPDQPFRDSKRDGPRTSIATDGCLVSSDRQPVLEARLHVSLLATLRWCRHHQSASR